MLDGADAGVEVIYKPTTVGGVQAIAGLIEEVRDRLNGGMHGGEVSPIVRLGKYDYSDPVRQDLEPAPRRPRLDVAGRPSPAPSRPRAAPPPSPPPSAAAAEQPRRRRVG